MTAVLKRVEAPDAPADAEDVTPSALVLTRLMRDVREDRRRTSIPVVVPRLAMPPRVENSDD